MEKAFKNLLKTDFRHLTNARLLLAVSGGMDSIVLTHLCHLVKLDFSIAHCNFNLRGKESDGDEDFVKQLGEDLEVKVFTESFDTETYAREAGVSIQMAARELRYNWFEEVRSSFQFDYVLTAHHANDNLETFLINLIRGSGLEGFTGIKAENNNLIRPLLYFSRKEIASFARENQLGWREDSSNASSKYMRNKIRHEIIPVLEDINPQFLSGFKQTQTHLNQSFHLVEDYISLLYNEIVSQSKYGYELKIETLQRVPHPKAVLYHLLSSFGFTQWNDVYDLLTAQPGKMVFSKTHRLIKDRDSLILTEKPSENNKRTYEIQEEESIVMLPLGTFTITEVNRVEHTPPHSIYLEKEKLEFPLTLRKWRKGDYFYPFGMKGKKKLSDFFKDKKLSLPEKEETWLLCSGEKIVWVVNYRADGRFAVTDHSRKIVKITYTL